MFTSPNDRGASVTGPSAPRTAPVSRYSIASNHKILAKGGMSLKRVFANLSNSKSFQSAGRSKPSILDTAATISGQHCASHSPDTVSRLPETRNEGNLIQTSPGTFLSSQNKQLRTPSCGVRRCKVPSSAHVTRASKLRSATSPVSRSSTDFHTPTRSPGHSTAQEKTFTTPLVLFRRLKIARSKRVISSPVLLRYRKMILMTQQNCREQISNILSTLERAIELEEYANMLLGLVRQAKREGSISQCDADQMFKQITQISHLAPRG